MPSKSFETQSSLSVPSSYGTYDEVVELKTATEIRREAALEAVRSRLSFASQLDALGTSSSVEVTPARSSMPGGELVGAEIQDSLEVLFSDIHSAGSQLKALGGIQRVVRALHSSVEAGINSASIPLRVKVFGENRIPDSPPITFWEIYKAAWNDTTILMLSIASVISLALGLTVPEPGATQVNYSTGWIEGFAILCSVLIVTGVSSVNDYRKEQKFCKLTMENSAQPIEVIRDHQKKIIDITEIVVGDIVNLSPGLVVPVDGFYVAGRSVVIDESSVTGENDPKQKTEQEPWILTGTVVCTAEEAFMIAGAVGERSFGGKLLMEARGAGNASRTTPLQHRLDDVAELIGRIGLSAALLLFAVLSIMEFLRLMQNSPEAHSRHFLDYFLLCLAILVVAVPEGLPLAVTISLAYSQEKMHKDNNQVRRLRACETMGGATQICSDKTGTLTQNVMSVTQGYIGMQYFNVKRPGDLPEKIALPSTISKNTQERLLRCIAVNSSSEKELKTTMPDGSSLPSPYWKWRPDKGNKTDNALLDFTDRVLFEERSGNVLPHQAIRDKVRREAQGAYAIYPFTSDRKRMSVVVREGDKTLFYVKGGSDRVLDLCDRYVNKDGEVRELDGKMLEVIQKQIRGLANEANRTIGAAYTELSFEEPLGSEEPKEMLIWVGLLGIQDPLRPEVVEAVKKCQMAGVMVKMCTGDNVDTAVAIARKCGIYNPYCGDIAMTGEDFRRLVYDAYGDKQRMEKFNSILRRLTVLGRSQPLDKQLLVLMLMLQGEVVAVTGDGTNDAPALRLANVGFVMRSGTDVAVKSADIVLLDDNFRSVQRAVVWGRCVNDNIRKFLQLQLTVNVVSVALTFIGSIAEGGASSPLTTVQLLWVNLIMDTLAALALATEEPSEESLQRRPVSRTAPLISRRMWFTIIVNGLYILMVTLGVQMWGAQWFQAHGKVQQQTIVFNVFVLCILVHMINCRKLYEEFNSFDGLWSRSKPCVAILSVCVLFQVVAVQTFGPFMNVEPLNMNQWIGCSLFSFVVYLCGVIARLIPIEEPQYKQEFDFTELDEEAQHNVVKLERDVMKVQQAEKGCANGKYLEQAMRLRSKTMWDQAIRHHLTAVRVVNAFRRARSESSLSPL